MSLEESSVFSEPSDYNFFPIVFSRDLDVDKLYPFCIDGLELIGVLTNSGGGSEPKQFVYDKFCEDYKPVIVALLTLLDDYRFKEDENNLFTFAQSVFRIMTRFEDSKPISAEDFNSMFNQYKEFLIQPKYPREHLRFYLRKRKNFEEF